MSDSENFDPRFDPAFQRGFAGEVTTSRRRPTVGSPSVLPASTATVPVVSPLPAPGAPPAAETEPAEPAPVESARAVEIVPQPARFLNGWTISIAVVGVLLILGGGWGVNALIEYLKSSENGATPNFYLTLIGLFASPLAITLGIGCFIGLLFLGASRRR